MIIVDHEGLLLSVKTGPSCFLYFKGGILIKWILKKLFILRFL